MPRPDDCSHPRSAKQPSPEAGVGSASAAGGGKPEPGKVAIAVVEPDSRWPELFADEKDRILRAMGDRVLAVEHIGSTAVPGLRAKPVIDIMIGVDDLGRVAECVEALARLGYRYLPEYEVQSPHRRFFRKGPFGASTHHLHVYRPDHPDWAHMIRLREYFREHQEAARAYEALKEDLAKRYPDDPVSYSEGKRSFLIDVRAAAVRDETALPAPDRPPAFRSAARRTLGRLRRGAAEAVRATRVGGWPRSVGGPEALDRRLNEAAATLERILVDAVLPFWRQRVVDRDRGGYHLRHDLEGRDLGPSPRHVVAQSRTLWFFSRIARSALGEPGDLEAARHGFDFLRSRLWDDRHGGFAWQVLADGEPLEPHKHALGQAYPLLALAEYWQASGDVRALALAARAVEVWDGVAHDSARGGYVEMHRRDWSPAEGLPGYWAQDPKLKMLDTHLHIADGLAALHRVAPEPMLEARLRELLGILTESDRACRQGVTAFRADWTPLPTQRVEYGFDLKRIALTAAVCAAAGVPRETHLELYRQLFAAAMRSGWDRRDGGLFEAGRLGRRAHELVKSWWTQAEALGASLQMWRLTGEARYAAVFLRTLDWVTRFQVDWRRGEWFELVDLRRRPSGCKAGNWKTPCHGVRTALDCLELLAARDRRVGASGEGGSR